MNELTSTAPPLPTAPEPLRTELEHESDLERARR
jgi:hypothetical protein